MAEGATGAPILLEDGWVVALDDGGTEGRLSVAVRDGVVDAVGDAAALRARHPAAERVDCTDRLILPGLVNAHLHPELQLLKGTLDGLGLHEWALDGRFQAALAVLCDEAGRPLQRAAIRASLADALLGGTTTVGTYAVTIGGDDVAADALAAFGLRGVVTVRDVEFRPRPQAGRPLLYRLHAEEALTEGELEAAARAHERGERIVMHCAETRHRVRLARRRFGETTVRLLARYGLLSPRVLLSHAVHVDREERALLEQAGVAILSSPSAELKLADGLAPVADYLARGLRVGLGTDAAVCNNGNDMILEMRVLALSQALAHGPSALPPERILRCATRDGAAALGLGDVAGQLAPGRPADLVLVDTASVRLQPLVRGGRPGAASNLVHAATGQDVTDVMIDGAWKVRHRRLLVADIGDILRDLVDAAAELEDRLRAVPAGAGR